MKKFYLVDVSSMFFRAFYAIPPLRTSRGLPTNALYGLLAMTIKLLRESRPDYMVFCFDVKEPSFRNEIYEDYKANRTEMPDDLQPQIPYIRQLIGLLGIPMLDKVGYEADDLIGTLATRAAAHNIEVSIVSGDKDFAQLVNGQVSMYDTMKNVRYDRAGVVEKWGVQPEQIVDYLAIVGDASDNIPGVRGIGPKGAQKLLNEYGTLENIYENLDKISSASLRAKLLEGKDSAFLAKKLVKIVTDVPLDCTVDQFQLKPIQRDQLKALLDELEFGGFMRKLFGEGATEDPSARSGANTKKDKVVAEKKSKKKVLRAEVTSLVRTQWSLEDLKRNIKPYDDVWVSHCERGFCLGYENQAIQVDAALSEIGNVLSYKKVGWKGYDIKSIWHRLDMPRGLAAPKWDTMLSAYVVKAGSIDDFASTYQNYTGQALMDLAAPEDYLEAELKLEKILRARLEETRGLSILVTLDLPLVPVLYDMEVKGILIDKKELSVQSHQLADDIKALEKQIYQMAGGSFNISSPKQLSQILFEKMKVPVVKKTKTGYSTDNDVLTKLAAQYPICNHIISFRELTKLKSTYVDALPALVDPRDGRLHTRFYQAVTQTGRLSSANPNLQNIPIRTQRGRLVRKAFKADKGCVLLSVDYSQIELRILAEITGDAGLTDAFRKGLDIHAATAAEIFNIKLDEVTPEHRRMAKAVNFGIAYGQGVFGLSETLGISRDEAKKIIDNYFQKFKKVKDYMMDTVSTAKERGYVETLFGRRRYIEEFKSSRDAVRKFGERAAINAPIQGTASDLMKKAMVSVAESTNVPILLQVHDELLLECPAEIVETEAAEIASIMESVAQFKVPLLANVAWGEDWDQAHA